MWCVIVSKQSVLVFAEAAVVVSVGFRWIRNVYPSEKDLISEFRFYMLQQNFNITYYLKTYNLCLKY